MKMETWKWNLKHELLEYVSERVTLKNKLPSMEYLMNIQQYSAENDFCVEFKTAFVRKKVFYIKQIR